MSLRLGSVNPSALKVGSTAVTKVCLGSSQVWPSGATSLLSTATSWWSPKLRSGDDLPDQKGSTRTALESATGITYSTDITHHYSQLRASIQNHYAIADDPELDIGASPFTVVLVARPQVNLTGVKYLFAKRSGSGAGWVLYSDGSTVKGIVSGTTSIVPTAGTVVIGTTHTMALVVDTTCRVVLDGTAGAGVAKPAGTISNVESAFINRRPGTTTWGDMDFYGAALFNGTALTDAQVSTVGSELLAAAAV